MSRNLLQFRTVLGDLLDHAARLSPADWALIEKHRELTDFIDTDVEHQGRTWTFHEAAEAMEDGTWYQPRLDRSNDVPEHEDAHVEFGAGE